MQSKKPLFNPALAEDFPWVVYNEQSGTLGCSICAKHAIRRTTFALGMFSVATTTPGGERPFRRSDLSPHEKSAVHIRAMKLENGDVSQREDEEEMGDEDSDGIPIVIHGKKALSPETSNPTLREARTYPRFRSRSPLSSSTNSLHTRVVAHALPPHWKSLVSSWLQEDAPGFDIGGYIVGETRQKAILYGKMSGVLAGVPFFNHVFEQVGCSVDWFVEEGAAFDIDQESDGRVKIAQVTGPARQLLLGERPALNALARASGIATRARRLLDVKKRHGWHGWIAGTRKTTPGFRIVEKYAMLVGGVDPHRYDLSSMVMLKDNHIWATGSISNAVKAARDLGGFSVKIEVECRSEQEACEAIEAGADIVMLDNFESEDLKDTSARLKAKFSRESNFLIEGSGGLTEANVASYFSTDVDILSFGALSQGVQHIDFSLKVTTKR